MSRPVIYGVILLFLLNLQSQLSAQCNAFSIPYENYFTSPNSLNCWDSASGAIYPHQYFNRIRFNDVSNTSAQGLSILISPPFYIDQSSRLSYSWLHINYIGSVNNGGINDSLNVYIKRKSEVNWTLLVDYPFPFKSPYNSSPFSTPYIYEDIALDTAYINDTVLFRFEFYAGINSQVLYLDNFRLIGDHSANIYPLPFQENFDGNNWRPDSGSTFNLYQYKVDDDWSFVPGAHNEDYSLKWVVGRFQSRSIGTGPLTDKSIGGNYLYSEASPSGIEANMYTPFIDVSNVYAQLSFWYHMHGSAMGTLYVEQNINSSWQILDSISGEQQKLQSDPWRKRKILLDSTGNTQIRFRMKSNLFHANSYLQDAAIDEIEIDSIICPFVNFFEVKFSNATTSSIQLDWPTGPNSNAYILEYDTLGFTPGNGIVDTVNNNSLILNGLSPNIQYEVYVRQLCNISDTSNLSGPFPFQTECFYTAPYLETFDDTIISHCWTLHNQTNPPVATAAWKSTGTSGFPAYGAAAEIDHTGNNGSAIGVDGSGQFPMDSIAILSPFFDVSGLINPRLSFWLFSNNVNFPGQNNTFYLDLYDGSQWQYSVLSYQGDSIDWVNLSLSLNQFNISGLVRFRLVVDKMATSAFFNDILIDDFKLEEGYGKACELPSSLTTVFEGCDSIIVSWKSNSSNGLTRIKYGVAGFDFHSSGTWINNVNSPYHLKNLMTTQNYDIYIVDSCNEGLGISMISAETDSSKLPVLNYNTTVSSYTDSSLTYFLDAKNTYGGNTFIWDFGGGNILYGDSVYITFYQNGSYPVNLFISNACGTVSTAFIIDIQDIDLEEAFRDSGIEIFPNPGSGIFEVSYHNPSTNLQMLKIWNSLGEKIFEMNLNAENNKSPFWIDLSHHPAGIYFLQYKTTDSKSGMRKLIIR